MAPIAEVNANERLPHPDARSVLRGRAPWGGLGGRAVKMASVLPVLFIMIENGGADAAAPPVVSESPAINNHLQLNRSVREAAADRSAGVRRLKTVSDVLIECSPGEKNAMVGQTVVRGPDWIWGNQDHGTEGTITAACDSDRWSKVQWANGVTNSYRCGTRREGEQRRYDLKLAPDDESVGGCCSGLEPIFYGTSALVMATLYGLVGCCATNCGMQKNVRDTIIMSGVPLVIILSSFFAACLAEDSTQEQPFAVTICIYAILLGVMFSVLRSDSTSKDEKMGSQAMILKAVAILVFASVQIHFVYTRDEAFLATVNCGWSEPQAYLLSGCSNPAHCGTFFRVAAHCTSGDHCPGGRYANGNTDSTLCDGAPVYQLGGPDGPVLYRWVGAKSDTFTTWYVSDSSTLTTCDGSGVDCKRGGCYLKSAHGPVCRSTSDCPEGLPTEQAFEGWKDFEASPKCSENCGISIAAEHSSLFCGANDHVVAQLPYDKGWHSGKIDAVQDFSSAKIRFDNDMWADLAPSKVFWNPNVSPTSEWCWDVKLPTDCPSRPRGLQQCESFKLAGTHTVNATALDDVLHACCSGREPFVYGLSVLGLLVVTVLLCVFVHDDDAKFVLVMALIPLLIIFGSFWTACLVQDVTQERAFSVTICIYAVLGICLAVFCRDEKEASLCILLTCVGLLAFASVEIHAVN
eukprot:COSAG02_NODE_152_length_33208_cov_13.316591_15_plen_690_part_00